MCDALVSSQFEPPRQDHWERLRILGDGVRDWRAQMDSPPQIDATHGLGLDDEPLPGMGVSGLAWFSRSSSVDNLDMVLRTINEGGLTFPFAQFTVARGGLLGAAHAVWLLHPEERLVRQSNALQLAHHDLGQEQTAARDVVRLLPEMADVVQLRVGEIAAEQAELVEVAERIGAPSPTRRINDTAVITAVAEWFALAHPGDPDIVMAFLSEWRQQSGVAHGLHWASKSRAGRSRDGSQPGFARITADVGELFSAVGSVSLLLSQAFRLFELRRTTR